MQHSRGAKSTANGLSWCKAVSKRIAHALVRETITFKHPFQIKGIDRILPPGPYEVIIDEEMIEGLSFAAFRRVATMITAPAAAPRTLAMERISISPVDLADAQRNDASAHR